jgi:hypothetical protein
MAAFSGAHRGAPLPIIKLDMGDVHKIINSSIQAGFPLLIFLPPNRNAYTQCGVSKCESTSQMILDISSLEVISSFELSFKNTGTAH